jgi:hypothetical protein
MSDPAVNDPNKVLNFVDHAPHLWRVLESAAAVKLVEPETNQRLSLLLGSATGTCDLLNRDGLP